MTTPREIHQLAVELCRSNIAARRRAAVSRAYYSLFHAVAEFLEVAGVPTPKGPESHGFASKLFLGSNQMELQSLGRQLGEFHHHRIRADYRLRDLMAEDRKLAVDLVNTAKELLDAIDDMRSDRRYA